jgi:YD repeat-containing protein
VGRSEYDFGPGTQGPLLRQTNNQYLWQSNANYLSANLLDRLSSTTVLNGSGQQIAASTYAYDENNGSPQGTFANQTSENRWLNTTGTYLTSKKVYNTQGMVTQSIDPLLNTTAFTYDSTGAFLSQVQRPTTSGVAHIEHFSHDSNTGLTTSHTDENGRLQAFNTTLRVALPRSITRTADKPQIATPM